MEDNKENKIFISWSKPISKAIAISIRDWLKKVLPNTNPFLSSKDIDVGSLWSNNLLNELKGASVGIVCLTPDNLEAPFIHFEAGALLAEEINRSRVCVYLYNLEINDVKPPLEMFQLTKFDKTGTLALFRAVNNRLGNLISDSQVEAVFNHSWDEFEQSVKNEVKRATHPNTEPVKWIQVSGSGNVANPLSPEIKNVCHLIGQKLAQQNFGIVTASWPLVDEEVTQAYSLERQNLGRKEFIRNVLRGDTPPAFRLGDAYHVYSPHEVWAKQATLNDACVLIGGEGGTLQTALWMSLAGKPIFPLAKTGGDAEKYYWACQPEPFKLNDKIPGVSKDDFEKLNEELPEVVDSLMELLNKWAYPYG